MPRKLQRHTAAAPQEFFARVIADARKFARRDKFDDGVCVVGMQMQPLN
jgi:hypothetical protein